MKRIFLMLVALVLIFTMAAPAQAEIRQFWAFVYSWDGSMNADGTRALTRITSGVTFKVLKRNADDSETCYYYDTPAMTSLTNPVTTTSYAADAICNDMVSFATDPAETNDTYVDLIVVDTAGGYTAFVEDFTEHVHTIVIDERPNVMHQGTIWFAFLAGGTEVDTGIDFDYDTFVHDVWIEVVTVDAAETIDVGTLSSGTDGDANGYRAAVSLATAGFILDTAVITNGATVDYTAASTYGADLVTAITGSDAVATCGGKSYIGHIITGANEQSLTYTPSSSDTAYGYIHYFFTRMR